MQCSVIIRTFNEERHIGRLIEGINRQEFINHIKIDYTFIFLIITVYFAEMRIILKKRSLSSFMTFLWLNTLAWIFFLN